MNPASALALVLSAASLAKPDKPNPTFDAAPGTFVPIGFLIGDDGLPTNVLVDAAGQEVLQLAAHIQPRSGSLTDLTSLVAPLWELSVVNDGPEVGSVVVTTPTGGKPIRMQPRQILKSPGVVTSPHQDEIIFTPATNGTEVVHQVRGYDGVPSFAVIHTVIHTPGGSFTALGLFIRAAGDDGRGFVIDFENYISPAAVCSFAFAPFSTGELWGYDGDSIVIESSATGSSVRFVEGGLDIHFRPMIVGGGLSVTTIVTTAMWS